MIFVCSVILITYGSKVLSTIFHGLFWFVAFLYLITLNLDRAGIIKIFNISSYIHFFLPVFYALFLAVMIKQRFKIIFLLFLLIPIPFIIYSYFYLHIISLLYHLISWPILAFITIYFQRRKIAREKEKKQMEIKNPITAVQSLSQQLLNNRKNISEKKIDEYLKLINDELKKTKNLTDNFLEAFKKGSTIKDRINIKEIIESVYELLKFELIKENITLEIDSYINDVRADFNKYICER